MSHQPVASRVHSLRPTAVNRVLDDVRRAQAAGRDVVSLMRGQPDSPTPPHVVAAAEASLRRGRTGYPDNQGEIELRGAVAEKLRRDNRLDYDPAREILVTDGATCGLALALAALVEPGDDVLLPDPVYDAYASPIGLFGGRAASIGATIRNGRFAFDRAALEAAWTPQARVLLLNHPWNPVGTVFTTDELRTITEFVVERDLRLISDEIYETLVYDGRPFVSPATISPEARERTVLVNSLSKTYAMTGWRVGYCAAVEETLRAMLLLLQQWSRGPATFLQDAAAVALREDQHCTRRMTAEYQTRRDTVVDRLSGIDGVRPLVPEGGLFVMVDVSGLLGESDSSSWTSKDVRRFLLNEHGVAVVEGAAYGSRAEGTLRVSFAAGGATLDRGLERLRNGLVAVSKLARVSPRPRLCGEVGQR